MIYLLLSMALAGDSGATNATQRRVNKVVERCAAGKVVKLLAHGGGDVSLHPLILTRPPTPAENRQFECVLKGMGQMPDLRLGFVGNEAEPDGS